MTQRAVTGTSTRTLTLTDEQTGAAATPSSVAVAGVAHDGSTLTLGAVANPSTGVYTTSMTIARPSLVTLTWTVDGVDIVETIDVVAGPYVTVNELRASDSSLSSTETYPPAALAEAIERAEVECFSITGRAWRRRYDVLSFDLTDYSFRLPFPDVRRLGKVLIDDVDCTATAVLGGGGMVSIPWGAVGTTVEVGFEHGAALPSAGIRMGLLIRARQFAQQGTSRVGLYSERVSYDATGSTVARMLPKVGSTGVAEVDALYMRDAYGGRGIA